MIDQFWRRATVARVVDGDTIDFDIDLGWDLTLRERCRLLDVNTPEMRTPEGKRWKTLVISWLGNEPVWLKCAKYRRGKYGRSLVEVYKDGGACLNEFIKEGMGDG